MLFKTTLTVQRRWASKIVAGGYKGKIQGGGLGGPLSKRYGWKVMPGNMVEVGYTIYKAQTFSGVAVDQDDDEMPFNMYPGLNTVRDWQGHIKATKIGVVKMSKLPGTEGTGDKVFLWVDPDYDTHYKKEYERHRHRSFGNEFVVDELDVVHQRNPRWTRQEDITQELSSWPKNPMWYQEGAKNFAKQPSQKYNKPALTEWQQYTQADQEMYYSKMNPRHRTYSFNKKRYSYTNEPLREKPISVNENGYVNTKARSAESLYTVPRHDRKQMMREKRSTYHVSDMFGTFWE